MAIANEVIPYGSPFLGLFCLAPLYIALYRCRSYKDSFVVFAVQVLTTHLISSYWLANFHGFAVFTLGASAAGTAFIGGMVGILAWTYPSTIKKDAFLKENSGTDCYFIFKRMGWFVTIWVLYEYVKSTGALAYPWGTLSMTAYRWRLFTQIVDITGIWGITFLFALFSALFAEGLAIFHRSLPEKVISNYRQALILTAALFCLSGAYGILQLLMPMPVEKRFNAVLVQQNIDPWETGDEECIAISKNLSDKGIRELLEQGLEPDLVIWSEGILSKKFPSARKFYSRFPREQSLSEYIKSKGTPFLIGGNTKVNQRKGKSSNSAILFDSNGEYSGFYSKIQLVPFAEKIPYADNPAMNAFMKNVVGFTSTFTSGFQYVLFKIPLKTYESDLDPLDTDQKLYETISLDSQGLSDPKTTKKYIHGAGPNPQAFLNFTTPICFEDAFPSICRNLHRMGSDVFLNITNDSWSKTRSSEIQHFIVASYRAQEFRSTLVRCTNSGYTAVLDPKGNILNDLPLFEEGVLACTIPIYESRGTVYSRLGDWLPALLFLVFIATVLWAIYGIKTTVLPCQPQPQEPTIQPMEEDPVTASMPAEVKKPAPKTRKEPAEKKTAGTKKATATPKAKTAASTEKNTKTVKKTAAAKTVSKTEKTTARKKTTAEASKKTAADKKPAEKTAKKTASKKTSKAK
ncbi:MAG: apolipoprotein N-acyltransferase [Treponema sp.]|nr:apolipoprotein N-acyltransferase [Candidatus Treponema equi]